MAEAKLVNVGNFYTVILSAWRSFKNFKGPNAEALTLAAKTSMGIDREAAIDRMIKTASEINKIRKQDSFISSLIEDAIREADVTYGHNGNLLSLANVFSEISMMLLSKGYHVRAAEGLATNCDELSVFFVELSEADEAVAAEIDTRIVVKDMYGVKLRAFVTGDQPSQNTKLGLDPAIAKKRMDAVIINSSKELLSLFARVLKPHLAEFISSRVEGATPSMVEEAVDEFIDGYGI